MEKKIKILQTVGSLGLGGNEIFVMNLFRNIDKKKFQVDFIVYDDQRLDFYDEIISFGSKVYFCTSRKHDRWRVFFEETMSVHRILQQEHYDIIHCHSCSFSGILKGVLPGAFTRRTKVISHSHNPGMPKKNVLDDLTRHLLKALISRLIDQGFSCSDIAGDGKYTKRFMASSRYHIINNSVDIDKYIYNEEKRRKARTKLELTEDVFVIGHVGRFEYQKNHRFLIDIFEKIIARNKKSKLLLIGAGSLFNEIKMLAEERDIVDNILFMGQTDSAELYYQAMDCFLLPSFYEGFPFVLVEAQINGLKCIISDKISKSVNISGGVEFVSLDKAADEWAMKVLEAGKVRLRKEQVDRVCRLYDLRLEIKQIEKLYMDLVNKYL